MNGDFYVERREGEGERKSVWKLRRWSKGRGHHTVMVKKEEEGEEREGREGEKIREDKDKGMAASGPNNENTSNKVCMYIRYSNFGEHTNFLFSDGHIM